MLILSWSGAVRTCTLLSEHTACFLFFQPNVLYPSAHYSVHLSAHLATHVDFFGSQKLSFFGSWGLQMLASCKVRNSEIQQSSENKISKNACSVQFEYDPILVRRAIKLVGKCQPCWMCMKVYSLFLEMDPVY